MLETGVSHSRVSSPFREESVDEELSVLPKNTKVIVTGNNRTKSVLVGLQGVVKKAVGLGGWHWLVLKNGIEVKLQRNALSVLEPPSGNEDDDTYELDHSSSSTDTDEKDHHPFSSGSQLGNVCKRKVQFSRPSSRSPPRKSINRSNYRIQCKCHTTQTGVNLAKLGTESLWRYWRRFNLGKTNPNPTRQQLVNAVQQHFDSQKVDEVQVITEFVSAAKRLQSVDKHESLDDQLQKNDSVS